MSPPSSGSTAGRAWVRCRSAPPACARRREPHAERQAVRPAPHVSGDGRQSRCPCVVSKVTLDVQPASTMRQDVLQRRFRTSWTVSTKRSSSSARLTSRRTTITRRSCARSSRSPGSTVTKLQSLCGRLMMGLKVWSRPGSSRGGEAAEFTVRVAPGTPRACGADGVRSTQPGGDRRPEHRARAGDPSPPKARRVERCGVRRLCSRGGMAPLSPKRLAKPAFSQDWLQ